MEKVFRFIKERIPAIADAYVVIPKRDRYGKEYFVWRFVDINMPKDINTGFSLMWHEAVIQEMNSGYSVQVCLRWETLQGGTNGVTIFNEYVE